MPHTDHPTWRHVAWCTCQNCIEFAERLDQIEAARQEGKHTQHNLLDEDDGYCD